MNLNKRSPELLTTPAKGERVPEKNEPTTTAGLVDPFTSPLFGDTPPEWSAVEAFLEDVDFFLQSHAEPVKQTDFGGDIMALSDEARAAEAEIGIDNQALEKVEHEAIAVEEGDRIVHRCGGREDRECKQVLLVGSLQGHPRSPEWRRSAADVVRPDCSSRAV